MRFSLATMTRRARNPRRSVIPIRPIKAPALRASELYGAAYADLVKLWASAEPAIIDAYARTLSEMTTDAPGDVAVQIGAVENLAGALALTIRIRLENWARRLEVWHRGRWRANVLTATGVDLATLISPGDARTTIETAIERNVELVKSVSDQARQRIADSVFRGFQRRAEPREVAKEIREAVAMARRRAINIAADQTTTLASQLDQERRRQAGIDSWFWVSSGKAHPREEHRARNGNLYSESADRVGQQYEGQKILKPPPADDLPGVPIHCGCTSRSCLIID